MTTLVIRSRKKSAVKKFMDLALQLGVEITSLTDEEKEEVGMIRAIREGQRTPLVSRETVMRNLRRK